MCHLHFCDLHLNRYTLHAACPYRCRLSPEQLLVPELTAEPLDPEAGPLQLDPAAWNYRWDHSQAGGDVCLYKLCLAGPAGPVKLLLR